MHLAPLRPHTFRAVCLAAVLAAGMLTGLSMPVTAQKKAISATEKISALEISARRLDSFQRGLAGTKKFGRLEFRGGLVLTSSDERFGGISGLIIAPDGRRFLAITDQGHWLSAEIAYAGAAPSGIEKARMGPILALNGRPLTRKRDADAEEIALLSGTLKNGVALVAFERNHRLVRHPVIDGALGRPTGVVTLPPDARRMKSNSGLEAVTVLRGGPNRGAILALAEDFRDANDHHTGWLLGKGAPQRLAIKDIGGFALTGAAALDDGSVLILERRFRMTEGVKMRLRHVPTDELKPGRVIEGETLIQSDMSYEIDNMEAIAVHTAPGGETVITLMSDDNFNPLLQRNLLLQFTLHRSGAKSSSQ
ncbi:esterase-like activity of phytase family protein [Hyphomicrobium sp. CS1BSMeth3]|uniref:esterase-like activity of phytase family protein n=1 Tax=Hyphomicrobium sp. CS1BSMeth3 TaxID=1892844 RepID=UPI00092FFC1E|nr:esterase-like activity of phytase family protein [Hyphomicrobium sp. CS1BSMeth3]